MMFSLFSIRRSTVRIFENGLEFKKHVLDWNDLESIESDGAITVAAKDGRRIFLPTSLADAEALTRHIKFKISAAKSE
jgi:hypothetical protein